MVQQDNKQINITLPDGSARSYDAPVTGLQIAQSIGSGLAKAAVAVRRDGELIDLTRNIHKDAKVAIVTKDSDEALELIRHDAAHIMAEAVQELFPGTQVTIGPAIEHGFYYDFARDEPFSTDDLDVIEKKMREIVARDEHFTREEWDRNEAIEKFTEMGEKYKAELIRDLPEDETISVYRQGDWFDLCRGPHLPSTKSIGTSFKLMKVAGAYWRGDSNNEMLHRIYGTAWRNDKELKAYLHMIEEAEKRDHRKLGREMDLFHLQEEAQGSVFWHDKGYTIWRELETYIRARLQQHDYQEVKTPQLIDRKLWEQSGHWEKFGENMFTTKDSDEANDDEVMAIKPMNCPAHVQIFKQGIKSYRDLPIRMAEFGCCHRNEPHGALHGIMRVRQFTQDDAHIFCREDQILQESLEYFKLQLSVYKDLGFENIKVVLSTRPEKRAGSDEVWDRAEAGLAEALTEAGLEFVYAAGEGAFYGPKVEFVLVDAIGRSWQCGTLQLDFVLPERLDAHYIAEDGSKQRPVMLHRAILGSLERFIGMLVENYAGKLPLWMAPVQAVVTTITSDADDYAREVVEKLKARGLRVELDLRNEKINYKIREHSLKKSQLILVVGGREAEEQTVALRRLGGKDQEILKLEDAIAKITAECASPLDK
jgi:threonyl-tRNA synthetase